MKQTIPIPRFLAILAVALATLAHAGSAMVMPPSTQFEVNGASLMAPRYGHSGPRITTTADTGTAPGSSGGDFRILCRTSHMLFDDPIVYVGQPGVSHLHTFFGNSDVRGSTTQTQLNDLANFGRSSCDGGTVNRSGYWIPALIDTATGFAKAPILNNVYYKANGYVRDLASRATMTTVPPAGLRMIAGNPSNSGPSFQGRWDCILAGGGTFPSYDGIMPTADCPAGSTLLLLVQFPECWDGVNLDSPNHQSHMAYVNPTTGCPGTHPVHFPSISYNIHWQVKAGDNLANWRLASDRYSLAIKAGRSAHGDWNNGWDLTILNDIVVNCLHARKDCHDNLLGDGRTLY